MATAGVEDFPVDLAWSADSTSFVVAGGEGSLTKISCKDGVQADFGRHDPGALAVAVAAARGGEVITTGQDGTVKLWSPDGQAKTVHRGTAWPVSPVWRADGLHWAIAVGKEIRIHAAGGALSRVIPGHSATLSQLCWRGQDELLAVGHNALFVANVNSGESKTFVLEGTPQTLALSPDKKIAATGLADGTINFRYLNNQKRSRMSGYEGKVDQTAWSANSRFLATSATGSSTIVIWDFSSKGPEGSAPQEWNGHEGRIACLAAAPDSPWLASVGKDCRLMLWRMTPGTRAAVDVLLLESAAELARWSPDGKSLAVATENGRIRTYSLKV